MREADSGNRLRFIETDTLPPAVPRTEEWGQRSPSRWQLPDVHTNNGKLLGRYLIDTTTPSPHHVLACQITL
jgi:hypothetical protein